MKSQIITLLALGLLLLPFSSDLTAGDAASPNATFSLDTSGGSNAPQPARTDLGR